MVEPTASWFACHRRLYPTTVCLAQQLQMIPYPSPHSSRIASNIESITSSTLTMLGKKKRSWWAITTTTTIKPLSSLGSQELVDV